MYVPKPFQVEDEERLTNVIRVHPFALLVTGGNGLDGTHLPLLAERDGAGLRLVGHMARANPQWRVFDGETAALAVFAGPHGYVSPNWYETDGLVPTWNYVAVHAHGRPTTVEDEARTREILARSVRDMESPATGGWTLDRVPEKTMAAMLKGIVAFEMPVDRLQGKFKLSQNRAPEDARSVAANLRALGDEASAALADAMEETF